MLKRILFISLVVGSGALRAEHDKTAKPNVAFPEPSIFADKPAHPPAILANKAQCYSALPVGDAGGELPPYFAQLGAEKGKGVRPIDPLKDLQNGDVLLTFDPTEPPENAIWDNLFKGTHHAMTVYRKDGEMFIVDSPKATPYKLYGMSYHVLRLRQYPPSIKTEADLQAGLQDPAVRMQIETWQANRQSILQNVSKYLETIHANDYAYDNELKTEALDPKALAALKADFDRGVFPPGFKAYCSELPFTIYAMAGVKGIQKTPLAEFVKNLKATLPQVKEEYPQLNDAEVIRVGVYQFINHPLVLTNLGVPKEEWPKLAQMGAAGFAKNPGIAGPKVAEMTGIVEKILSTPDWALAAGDTALSSFGGFFAADSTPVKLTKIITPHCLSRQLFDPKSYFEYVGSNIECGPGTTDANLIQPFMGGLGDVTLAKAKPEAEIGARQKIARIGDPKLVATLPMHSIQTQMRRITIGPSGNRTLSVGDDDTAVLTDLATGAPTVVGEADYRIAPTFSRDGLKAAWVGRDKQLSWLDMKTRTVRKVLLEGETTAVHFTQGSDAIVRAGRNGTATLHPLSALDNPKVLDLAPHTLASAVAPTGDVMAAGTRGGEVRLVSLRSGESEVIRDAVGPRVQVTKLAFSTDGTRLAVATNQGKIDFYNTAAGKWIPGPTLTARDRGVTDVVFSDDFNSVVFSTAMGGIYQYDLTTQELRAALAPSVNPTVIPKIAISSDGKSLAAQLSDKAIAFYDLTGKAPVRTGVSSFAKPVTDLTFVPGSQYVLAASGLSAHLIGNHEQVGANLTAAMASTDSEKDRWLLKQLLTRARAQKTLGPEGAKKLLESAPIEKRATLKPIFESLFPGI